MQILEVQEGSMPFFEVRRQLLKRQKTWKRRAAAQLEEKKSDQTSYAPDEADKAALKGRNWVAKNVCKYLETTAAADLKDKHAKAFLAALDAKRAAVVEEGLTLDGSLGSWELMPTEKLQMLDMRPSSTPELYCVVEQCKERFSSDDITELLGLIDEFLPDAPWQQEDEDEEFEGEEGGEELAEGDGK
mmetsp:Transcript_64754/g.130236  ORF Transcript_64754/g.130236 Transcript_64754/m.130236 type:complete len:188 (+) Transcript_64754:143-706(+)|eukprot:CAMPEP_0171631054 /NCGR_PEP_ID=MMETSP0990-20121206/23392_1 /TAXON_ID=483369 /ORGANISM="non described non described, Strain CCMP2098" /LENGTH=187 /DNA_ID=CAMNT_0012200533 /DNA_START=103 /DNA_END=666 /DNA_ORIENTATION=+